MSGRLTAVKHFFSSTLNTNQRGHTIYAQWLINREVGNESHSFVYCVSTSTYRIGVLFSAAGSVFVFFGR